MMLYAQVVVGIPVEGPFDYIVPENLAKIIKVGVRVEVSFRTKEIVGYVIGLAAKTKIKNLKSILQVIDYSPILDKKMLLLTRELSDYYCCSWGEAIETALPEALRKGKRISNNFTASQGKADSKIKVKSRQEVILIHDLDGWARWEIYLKYIKETLQSNRSVIVLLPDINSLFRTKETITAGLGIQPALLYRKQAKELEEWFRVKEGKVRIVVGTRSSIFAPLDNLGLVIIDEEENAVYKQDQVPHYHARVVAFLRAHLESATLLLGSASPSLETFSLAKGAKIKYIFIPRKRIFPEIKIIDTKLFLPKIQQRNIIGTKYLQDAITLALNAGEKALLFLNRKGFATFASCRYCGTVLKCPRCNINLVYYFQANLLSCHYCNFKMPPPKICPQCNSSYIRYSGVGTEKIESELTRLFPQAKIKRLDNHEHIDINTADIFISTQSILREIGYNFSLTGILLIDNSLNRIDFRASEKTFGLLVRLLGLTEKKLVIQTDLPHHHCFSALENKNIHLFYDEELRQRKELKFPPDQHIALVKLRGKKESRVKEVSNILFNRLNQEHKDKAVKIVSVNPAQPAKLRGNFYRQIFIKSANPKKISKFLKINLKDFSHSGIIVTIDIDPI